MFAAGIPLVSAALSVAFPGEGQSLPAVERTYVIGAVSVSNDAPLVVNGATTDVWRTGAFLAMVPVKSGTNTLDVTCGQESLTRQFVVAEPPKPGSWKPFKPITSAKDPRLGKPAAWRFAPVAGAASFEGIDPTGNLGSETTVLYQAVLTDEGYERVPVTQDNVVEKSADRKAADAAATIFYLREKRQQIATGDTDATFSDEALRDAIKEITRLEERYMSLFYGIREVSDLEKTFDVTPDPEAKNQRYTAFHISEKNGLLPAPVNEGEAVTLEFIVEPLATPEASSDRSKEPLVHYRIPAITRCRVVQGGAILLENRIPVYQLGEESTLPLNILLSK